VLTGAGLGGFFALGLVVALDHLNDPEDAAALGALMQGGGFVIAALAPWMVALLHGMTGSFASGWWLHVACVLVVINLVRRLNPAGYALAMKPAEGGSRTDGVREVKLGVLN
ncbi:MAG: hypothetical protein ACAI34_15155, partial [Verrucomicrobium sp.]